MTSAVEGAIDTTAPLGVFDSGLGGLTVVHALRAAVPAESIVYLGDTARVPYGTRSAETVINYALGCSRLLLDRGVKSLVIACNTVSAVALDMLRAEFDVPVIGVVEPGAQAACAAAAKIGNQQSGAVKIGVLGTQSTIASGAYTRAVSQFSTRFEVISRAAPLLVPLVEEGWVTGQVPRLAVERYLTPLIEAGISVLVLGCTHYPLLRGMITEVARELAGKEILVVDGAMATATAVQALLTDRNLKAPSGAGTLELLVTDLPASFADSATRFLGEQVGEVTQVDLGAPRRVG
ncbi:MAG TPA: glutamate racemase [Polyangiaceae bacterium]|nr:glutamate racemase [Polyangiaceae bacterium]